MDTPSPSSESVAGKYTHLLQFHAILTVTAALPSLQSRPTFEELTNALEDLTIQPSTWSSNIQQETGVYDVKGVNDYLLSVISSGLNWLKVESDDEAIPD